MASNQSPTNPDALLSLIERVKENYQEPPESPPKRGKKRDFSALSFLLLAVVAVTMRTFRDSELRKLLEKDQKLRESLGFECVQRIIQALGLNECQVKGEGRNGAFVLASVWLYQICFLMNYREGKPLACIKDHLDCARWRIPSG